MVAHACSAARGWLCIKAHGPNLIGLHEAGDLVGTEKFQNVTLALERFAARPAVVKGLGIPKRS